MLTINPSTELVASALYSVAATEVFTAEFAGFYVLRLTGENVYNGNLFTKNGTVDIGELNQTRVVWLDSADVVKVQGLASVADPAYFVRGARFAADELSDE
jgi:hypothetical protein